MKLAVFCLYLAILFCPWFASAEDSTAKPGWSGRDGELARTLFLHTKASAEKIRCLKIEFESESTSTFDPALFPPTTLSYLAGIPAGQKTDTKKGTLLWRGEIFCSSVSSTSTVAGTAFRVSGPMGFCLNDRYFAHMTPESPNVIYLQEHLSLAQLQPERKQFANDWIEPKVFLFGFGDGRRKPHEYFDRFTHPIEWTVSEATGSDGKEYRLIAEIPSRAKHKVLSIHTIAADKGYLITSSETHDADGSISYQFRCTPRDFGNGFWLPGEAEAKVVDSQRSAKHHFKILHAEVNLSLPDSEFTFDKFEYSHNSLPELRRRSLQEGEQESLFFSGTDWVPKELLTPEQRKVVERRQKTPLKQSTLQ